MASSVKISNANGKIVTIENNDSNMSDVTLNGASITKKVDTLANMRAMGELPETVWCSGYHSKNDGAFGSHFYRLKGLKTTETDNSGTVIIVRVGGSDYAYELQFDGAVNVKWFGAVGNGTTSDTVAFNDALALGGKIVGNLGDNYLVGSLTIGSNTEVDLMGSTLTRNTTEIPGNINQWHVDSWIFYILSSVLENITIKNGTINDRHTEAPTVHRGFMGLNGSTRITNLNLLNLDFLDSYAGVYTSNACLFPSLLNSTIRECNFYNPAPVEIGVATLDVAAIPYALVAGDYQDNTLVERCTAIDTFSLSVFVSNPFRPDDYGRNNTVNLCTAKNTVDTSIYFYGDSNTISNNLVVNPGKDGLKINTNTAHSSSKNSIIGNTVYGSPAQHQADGGSMIVMVGDTNKCKNNTVHINNASNPHNTVTRWCIAVDGKDSVVSGNTFKSEFSNVGGILIYRFINVITDHVGIIVSENTIDCGNFGIAVLYPHTRYSIINNTIISNIFGLFMQYDKAQTDVRIPVFATISGNLFHSDVVTAQHIQNYHIDRVAFNNNRFTGRAQRDLQHQNSVGGWIGTGNVSEKLNDPVYYGYIATFRGVYFATVPTAGTFKRGEIVAGTDLGYRCKASGTMGTITGVTASTTAASKIIVLNIASVVHEGNYITIAGEAGVFTVESVADDKVTATLKTAPTLTAAGVAVAYSHATWTVGSEFYV